MYQRQKNTLWPKGGKFCENNFLKLTIDSQPIIGGKVFNLWKARVNIASISITQEILFAKSATFV